MGGVGGVGGVCVLDEAGGEGERRSRLLVDSLLESLDGSGSGSHLGSWSWS